MKFCHNCGREISKEQAFCQHCGASQDISKTPPTPSKETEETIRVEEKPKKMSDFLLFLCILSILGSIFGMFRGLIYEIATVAMGENDSYIRGWLYAISNLGTLIGAILMLLRQLNGLYIYTVSNVVYILTVLFATSVYDSDSYFEGAEQFAWAIGFVFVVPSILFIFLFWLDVNKKQLTK